MKKIILLLCMSALVIFGQAQISRMVNVTTAGTLGTLLTIVEKSTVTNLTLTGTIDARDFKLMQDTLSLLSVLDLSAVNIAAYTGTNGTYVSTWDFTAKTYPENEIPQFSFWYNGTTGNTVLKTLILPNSITSLGEYSFAKCKGLIGDLTIPNSVTTIKTYAFGECTGLKGKLSIPSSVIIIGDYAFSQCGFTGALTIPNSVTSIGENAFQSCTGFTGNLIIPNSVTTISGRAFVNCYGFRGSLTLSNSISKIGYSAFGSCFYLTGSLVIPNSVNTIEVAAFSNCMSISELLIPYTVQTIGDNFINGCTQLKKISTSNPTPLVASANMFYGFNQAACTLEVPLGSKVAYQQAVGWKNFTQIIEKDFSLRNVGLKIGKNGGVVYNNYLPSYNDTVITVNKDVAFTLKLLPKVGYEVDTLTLNGIDIKSNLINNKYACTISDNSQLKVTFKLSQFVVSIKSAISGTIDLYYDYGSIPVFKITPAPDWQIHSVMLNGIEIINVLQNGLYTLSPITDNVVLNVAFEYNTPTNIASNFSKVKVYAKHSDIIIEGTYQGEDIILYTLDGIQVFSTKSMGEQITIPAKKDEIYLVKRGRKP